MLPKIELSKENLPYILPILFFLPAFLINLGSMPLLADEPTRAIVALEMLISKNYIVPTIIGEYYYNKPPLYNWLLLTLYNSTGYINEWIIRLPTVFFMLVFSYIIYFFIKLYLNRKIAFIAAFAYLTCGRILFYDSFLGLIDTVFSSLIFLNFMLIYHFDQKKNYFNLFIITYLIATILYMLKGLPGLVFQSITIVIFFTLIKKDIKRIFSFYHIVSILMMLIIISTYYFYYNKYNDLSKVFTTIINESTKRTIGEKSFLESIKHILVFPFKTVVDFLPWTIPFFLIVKRRNFTKIMNQPFLKYIFFIFIGNILIYWLSPDTVPRYLFMFLPLLFTLSFFLYEDEINSRFKILFEKALLVISVLLLLVFLVLPFISIMPDVPLKYLKIVFIVIALSFIIILFYKNKSEKVIIFFSILLVTRIGFDWFVFPIRLKTEPQVAFKMHGIEVGKITKGSQLCLYKYSRVDHDISFYITRERMDILKPYYSIVKPNVFYLTDVFDDQLKLNNVTIYYTFNTSWENKKIYLVKLKT